MNDIKLLEALAGRKVVLKEAYGSDSFAVTPKDASFTIYGMDKVIPGLDYDYDTEDMMATLYWEVSFEKNTLGINGIDISGKMEDVRFRIIKWGDDEDEDMGEQKIDTSDYEIEFDLQMDSNTMYVGSVDIYVDLKKIRVY